MTTSGNSNYCCSDPDTITADPNPARPPLRKKEKEKKQNLIEMALGAARSLYT